MRNTDIVKNVVFSTADLVGYVPNTVITKSILKKSTGHVCITSADAGDVQMERVIPFDIHIQVIDGHADIVINGKTHHAVAGESIVVPAHAAYMVRSDSPYKIIHTVIKSGYEL